MRSARINRLADSATLMVLANLMVKGALLLFLAPLGVRCLGAERGLEWTLLINLVSLAVLFDLGVSAIVSRHITASLAEQSGRQSGTAEAQLFGIIGTARFCYRVIAILYIGAVLCVWLSTDMSRASGSDTLFSLGSIVATIGGGLYLRLNYRYAILMGHDGVAHINRIQAICGFASLPVTLLLLFLDLPVAALASIYAGLLVPALLFRKRVPQVGESKYALNRVVLADCGRAAFGVGASLVLYNAASYYYNARFADHAGLLSALLLLQLLRGASSFSQAPFYSRLPAINLLFAKGQVRAFLTYAIRRMGLAVGLQITAFAALYLLLALQLKPLQSVFSAPVSTSFYVLLSAALVMERLAAMLLQVYTATGHVIWHIVNGLSGIAQVILLLWFDASFGLSAFPAAMLVAIVLIQLPIVGVCLHRRVGIGLRAERLQKANA